MASAPYVVKIMLYPARVPAARLTRLVPSSGRKKSPRAAHETFCSAILEAEPTNFCALGVECDRRMLRSTHHRLEIPIAQSVGDAPAHTDR